MTASSCSSSFTSSPSTLEVCFIDVDTNQEENGLSNDISSNKHKCKLITCSVEFLKKLEIKSNVKCTIAGCGETFLHEPALNLHLEKVHRVFVKKNDTDEFLFTRSKSKRQKAEENCKCEYFCPIENCKFNMKSRERKSLPTFHSLKLHFMRIHGNKPFECVKCLRHFGLNADLERHEKTCGFMYVCKECNAPFSTEHTLVRHLKLKKHQSPVFLSPVAINCSSNVGAKKICDMQNTEPKDQINLSSTNEKSKNGSSSSNVSSSFILIPIFPVSQLNQSKKDQETIGTSISPINFSENMTYNGLSNATTNMASNDSYTQVDLYNSRNTISTSPLQLDMMTFINQETQTFPSVNETFLDATTCTSPTHSYGLLSNLDGKDLEENLEYVPRNKFTRTVTTQYEATYSRFIDSAQQMSSEDVSIDYNAICNGISNRCVTPLALTNLTSIQSPDDLDAINNDHSSTSYQHLNTNSIQTQTTSNFWANYNYVNTLTQTEFDNL